MKNSNVDLILEDASTVLKLVDASILNEKSILITGASGIIGLHLVGILLMSAALKGVNFKLTVIFRSEPEELLSRYLAQLNAIVIVSDLADQRTFKYLETYDLIFHAAGYGQPGKFLSDPVKTISLNTTATIELLKVLNVSGKFLFVSTSELYSGCQGTLFNEDQIGNTTPQHPRACYIEAKRTGEAICHAALRSGIQAYSARLALAYGPGTKPGDQRVLYNFIESGIKNGRISLLDQGEALRTYCYVSDAIEIFFHILSRAQSSVYNVGGKSRVSIRKLAQTVGEMLNVPVVFPNNSDNALLGSPTDVTLDMTLVEREFGKKDYLELQHGLERTVNWILDRDSKKL
jgi:UDP-glucuronate decarboxylase